MSQNKFAVRRINVAYAGGVALEKLTHLQQRNISVGVYATGWHAWHFVNERDGIDPDKQQPFYYELALRLLREKGIKP